MRQALLCATDTPAASRENADACPLYALPVANRSLIEHALDRLAEAGVDRVAVVVDRRRRREFMARTASRPAGRLKPTYLEGCGALPGALEAARCFMDDAPFAVVMADGLVGGSLRPLIEEFERERPDALVVTSSPARRREVPGAARAMLAPDAAGFPHVALLDPGILRLAMDVTPAWGAASELQAALRLIAGGGGTVIRHEAAGWWRYGGWPEQLLEANRLMLDRLDADYDPALTADNAVQGRVVVHPSARVDSSTIRGPAIIGPGVRLADAFVGAYTSLGEEATVEGAEIEYSIVMPGASLMNTGRRLEGSIIGPGARVYRDFGLPSALRLQVGPRAEVAVS
jgi:glucose-1-phosphate thymidylyltransferase